MGRALLQRDPYSTIFLYIKVFWWECSLGICLASLLQLVMHFLELVVTSSLDLCLAWGVARELTLYALRDPHPDRGWHIFILEQSERMNVLESIYCMASLRSNACVATSNLSW